MRSRVMHFENHRYISEVYFERSSSKSMFRHFTRGLCDSKDAQWYRLSTTFSMLNP